jgi:biopolymer transport protein ExbD
MLIGKKKDRKAEVPMASLADIAFLLLIFFLVTTTIDVDRGIGLTLPGKGEEQEVRTKNIANLLINAEGRIFFDNGEVPVEDLNRLVREKIAENPNLIISVKTVRETEYNVYVKVLDQLKTAKATRISIAEPDKA